ncbi:hypothetical protein GEMRC1_007847 [Eukaryota sp. GEM-RC1]
MTVSEEGDHLRPIISFSCLPMVHHPVVMQCLTYLVFTLEIIVMTTLDFPLISMLRQEHPQYIFGFVAVFSTIVLTIWVFGLLYYLKYKNTKPSAYLIPLICYAVTCGLGVLLWNFTGSYINIFTLLFFFPLLSSVSILYFKWKDNDFSLTFEGAKYKHHILFFSPSVVCLGFSVALMITVKPLFLGLTIMFFSFEFLLIAYTFVSYFKTLNFRKSLEATFLLTAAGLHVLWGVLSMTVLDQSGAGTLVTLACLFPLVSGGFALYDFSDRNYKPAKSTTITALASIITFTLYFVIITFTTDPWYFGASLLGGLFSVLFVSFIAFSIRTSGHFPPHLRVYTFIYVGLATMTALYVGGRGEGIFWGGSLCLFIVVGVCLLYSFSLKPMNSSSPLISSPWVFPSYCLTDNGQFMKVNLPKFLSLLSFIILSLWGCFASLWMESIYWGPLVVSGVSALFLVTSIGSSVTLPSFLLGKNHYLLSPRVVSETLADDSLNIASGLKPTWTDLASKYQSSKSEAKNPEEFIKTWKLYDEFTSQFEGDVSIVLLAAVKLYQSANAVEFTLLNNLTLFLQSTGKENVTAAELQSMSVEKKKLLMAEMEAWMENKRKMKNAARRSVSKKKKEKKSENGSWKKITGEDRFKWKKKKRKKFEEEENKRRQIQIEEEKDEEKRRKLEEENRRRQIQIEEEKDEEKRRKLEEENRKRQIQIEEQERKRKMEEEEKRRRQIEIERQRRQQIVDDGKRKKIIVRDDALPNSNVSSDSDNDVNIPITPISKNFDDVDEDRRRRFEQQQEEQERRRQLTVQRQKKRGGWFSKSSNQQEAPPTPKPTVSDPLSKYDELAKTLSSSNQLFSDENFPAGDKALGPALSSRANPNWKRVSQLGGQVFQGTPCADRVQQGSLGDCWLISAIAVCATRPDLIQHLFVKDYTKNGFYVLRFHKNCSWTYVTIDDFLPVRGNNLPLFCHSSEAKEFFPALIEKAYAKIHGNYETIEGGHVSVGLSDLTGGIADEVRFKKAKSEIASGALWRKMRNYVESGYLLGAGSPSGKDTDISSFGIVQGHAYSILQCVEVENLKLIQLRNPWGDSSWKGDYGPTSTKWTAKLKKRLDFSSVDDGKFWMTYGDYVAHFDSLYICRFFDKHYPGKFRSAWSVANRTAGGRSSADNRDTFITNPQYRLRSSKPGKCGIVLRQDDRRMQGQKQLAIGFYVCTGKGGKITIATTANVYAKAGFIFLRELFSEIDVEAGVDYTIVPCTWDAGQENGFGIMAFGEHPIEFEEIRG